MIEDLDTADWLLDTRGAERIAVAVPSWGADAGAPPTIVQGGVRILRGQAGVRAGHILPVVDGKTSSREFLEYNASKFPASLFADLGAPTASWSKAVAIIGSGNYYHFLANHLPALLLMRAVQTPRVHLLMVDPFPAGVGAVMNELLPYLAGNKPVDVTLVQSGTYDVTDVIFPTRAHMDMPVLLARRVILPHVLEQAGVADPLHERGPLKLYVRRSNAANARNLLNPQKVEAWFIARGYTPVDPGTLSFTEQVLLFARATHIAGVEGGAMTNVIFAPFLKQVVMLASPFTREDRFFQNLVAGYGIPFHPLYGDVIGATRDANYIMPLAALAALPLEATA